MGEIMMSEYDIYGLGDTYTVTTTLGCCEAISSKYADYSSKRKKHLHLKNIHQVLFLVYQDKNGDITERKIKLEALDEGHNGVFFLKAFCYLRNNERVFNGNRIRQLKTENGKVITLDDLIKMVKRQQVYRKRVK
jgi:arginyl-tRNA synthetase